MKLPTFLWVTVVIVTATSGCATRSTLYQSWGNQIEGAAETNLKKEDISLMLGVEPNKCENVSVNPMIGILLEDIPGPTIRSIHQNGSAANTDIKVGDKIISVGAKLVRNSKQVVDAIRELASPGHPIMIETQRKSYALIPKYPAETIQCYWEITAGQVGKFAGSASVNQYGGRAIQGGSEYQRFFRATCRFNDGRLTICQSNWQE